jgi:hypothetical protein
MAERPDPDRDDTTEGDVEAHGVSKDDAPKEDAPKDVQSGAGAPDAPLLTRPKEESLVDGDDVTLQWEAVEGAEHYLVEVAEDAPFHEVVVQEEVDGTSLSLDALPTDDGLYYWRVLTRRGGEWSHGDRIESFVSTSPDQVHAGSGEAPDRSESYGPVAELVSFAGTEAAAEATGDEARFAREREMGVAHEGVEAGQIIGLAGVVIVALIIIVCILFFWITSVADDTRDAVTETSVYPELEATETRAAEQLDQYELVSERDSAYRIPIGEAMRIVVDEAYETGTGQRYSGELQIEPPTTLADSLDAGAFVPEPSAPEGPAAAPQTQN